MNKAGEGHKVLVLNDKEPKETLEQLTKQIAKGGSIASIGSMIGKALGFGLHILLGRILGPAQYGLYALGRSVMGITQSIATLGLNQGVVRYGAIYRGERDNARVKGTILSALGISMVFSILISALLVLFSSFIAQRIFKEPELIKVLQVLALALPFYVLMGITTSFAQSFRRIWYQQGVLKIFNPIVHFLLVGIAFLLGFRLAGAVYGFLISGVLSAGLGFYFLWKIFPEVKSLLAPSYNIRQLLFFSLPTFFIGISYLLLNYTDRIMLGYFRAASDVGIYSAASTTSLQMAIFLAAFITIFSPIVSNLYNQAKRKELENLFKVVTRWVFTLTLPLFIIIAIFSKSIMLIFGSEFVAGWIVLIILAFAQLVNVGTGPVGMLLQMTGKQYIDFANGWGLFLCNIGLNLWLIPIYGALGAALATGISLMLIHIARLVEVLKILYITPYDKRFIKPILAGLIMAIGAIFFKLIIRSFTSWIWIFLGLSLLVIVYIAILYAIGLDQEDKIVLSAVKRKLLKTNFSLFRQKL